MSILNELNTVIDKALNDATWALPTVQGAVPIDREKLEKIRNDTVVDVAKLFGTIGDYVKIESAEWHKQQMMIYKAELDARPTPSVAEILDSFRRPPWQKPRIDGTLKQYKYHRSMYKQLSAEESK